MTTDLAAPPQTRPPHINPQWWYRATWHARQAAINAHNQQLHRIERLRANVEKERIAHEARYRPTAPIEPPVTTERLNDDDLIKAIDDMLDRTDDINLICRELGKTPGALDMRMRRAGRTDLARMFAYVRNAARYKPCPDCGANMNHKSARCRKCAPLVRAEVAA